MKATLCSFGQHQAYPQEHSRDPKYVIHVLETAGWWCVKSLIHDKNLNPSSRRQFISSHIPFSHRLIQTLLSHRAVLHEHSVPKFHPYVGQTEEMADPCHRKEEGALRASRGCARCHRWSSCPVLSPRTWRLNGDGTNTGNVDSCLPNRVSNCKSSTAPGKFITTPGKVINTSGKNSPLGC